MKEHTTFLSPEGAKDIGYAAYIGVLMIKHLIALTPENWITIAGIAATVILAVIGGIFTWYRWKKDRTPKTETPPLPPPPPGTIHNLPYGPIGNLLKGRNHQLKKLQNQLTAGKPAALHGLGGVGKTRLAVEFAWLSLQNQSTAAALFVSADSVSSLNTNLAALAAPNLLNLPEFNQPDQALIVEAVINNLARRSDWLLILDNVDDENARQYLCNDLLPRLTASRVIITSRLANWPPDIADLPVTKLNTKAASAYLRHVTKNNTKKDIAPSEKLAQTLDGLPVALEQAAAYIKRTRITFDKYRREFEISRTKTLERYEELVNYPSPTLFTWTATQERLNPLAHTILRLAAFLAPDPIPTNLFDSQSDALAKGFDLLKQEEAYQEIQPPDPEPNLRDILAELADWSMINLSPDSFLVHRLVQDAVRLTIPSDLRKSWTDLALNLIHENLPADPPPHDVRSWPLWTNLESHVSSIIHHANACRINEPTTRLMNGLGLYLKERIRFPEAENLYRRALKIDEDAFGPDHPNVARDLNNLAQLLQATNRLDDAEPLMKRVIEIFENSFGKEHPNVATSLNNLAQLLQETNRLKDAEPLIRRTLEIDETSLGPNHPNVARDLNNLATLLKATNRLDNAESLMKRVVGIYKKSYGKEHPNVAIALNNLAQLLQDTNRPDEAESLMRRALEINENSFGPDHPNVARDLNNLASLLYVANQLADAEPLMRRALEIDENSFGPDHPDVARDLNNLAQLLQDTNRIDEAEPMYRRALEIDEKSLGPDHPKVATDLNNLA